MTNPASDPSGSYILVPGTELKAQNGSLNKGNAYDPTARRTFQLQHQSGGLNGPPTATPLDFANRHGPTRNVFNVTAVQLFGNTSINIVYPTEQPLLSTCPELLPTRRPRKSPSTVS